MSIWKLIHEFKKITNVGILVNSSFIVRDESTINSPEDAFKCFMNTEIDYLVIENYLLSKDEQSTKIKRDEFEMD